MWSTVATAFKLALLEVSPLQLLAGASFFSLIVISLFLYRNGLFSEAINGFRIKPHSILLLALLNPIAYYLVLLHAYDLLPAQIAQSLNYLWAIALTLLSVPMLKYKLSKRDLIAIVIAYLGVVCIFIGGKNITGELNFFGLFLVLLSTVIWAYYWLLMATESMKPLFKLLQSFIVGFPVLLLLTLYFDGLPLFSLKAWLYLAYVGIFEMGLAFIFWQLALQNTDNVSKISILVFLSPVISLFFISSVLGEAIYWTTFLGLGFIIAGILLQKQKT
jgi:drug/metabolite transporter (DMT)-like permease